MMASKHLKDQVTGNIHFNYELEFDIDKTQLFPTTYLLINHSKKNFTLT